MKRQMGNRLPIIYYYLDIVNIYSEILIIFYFIPRSIKLSIIKTQSGKVNFF